VHEWEDLGYFGVETADEGMVHGNDSMKEGIIVMWWGSVGLFLALNV